MNGAAIAWFALAGVLTIFIGRVFLYASIQHLGAVRASAIKRLNPFFSVLLGVVLLGDRLDGPMLAGMALISLSFAVLVLQSLQTAPNNPEPVTEQSAFDQIVNLGYFYGPVSVFAYAA